MRYSGNDSEKVEKICKMILEIASGNFSYRIEPSGNDDHFETIIVLLNMMTEEIRESFQHFALVNPRGTYQQIAQMSFFLDQEFKIINLNRSAQELIGLQPGDIYGTRFETYLTSDSKLQWKKEIEELNQIDENFNHSLRLFFASKNSLTVPSLCTISSLLREKDNRKTYFVTALRTTLKSGRREEKIQQTIKGLNLSKEKMPAAQRPLLYRKADIRKVQEVYDYILNNLEKPLPSLKELAHRHGTNEFKLKIGFRQLYNTSVFFFQKEQRLKRAHSFIVNSDLSLGRISEMNGFKSLSHFSKSFKNKYGYNPSELKKRTNS